MLGDRHRSIRRLPPEQGRLVRGCNHDDAARQTLRTEIVFDELSYFPPALTDQGHHGHVALGLTGQHGQQRGLTYAGACEHAHTLTGLTRDEQIQCAHAQAEPGPEATARGRRWRICTDGLCRTRRKRPEPIERQAKRIDDPAKPARSGIQHGGRIADGIEQDGCTRPNTIERAERLHTGQTILHSDDFGHDGDVSLDGQPRSEPAEASKATHLGRKSSDRFDLSTDEGGRSACDIISNSCKTLNQELQP